MYSNNNNNNILNIIFTAFVIFYILISFPLFSKSFNKGKADGHEADMYSVLPFKRSPQVSQWLEFIHKTIDFPYNKYFDGLRNAPHQNFSWGKYGHRIFFHWGFNSEPWSPQIQEQVNKCGWDKDVIDKFKDKLKVEQAKRNKAILEKTAILFNLNLSGKERAYANALASIVSDVHLLGDYTTENIAPLPNLQFVINDIKTALYERLNGGNDAQKINILLDNTKNEYPNSKERAQAVLDILKAKLPKFLLLLKKEDNRSHPPYKNNNY